MTTSTLQSCIYRLFSDLIKADNVISRHELDALKAICEDFCIAESDILGAYQITLSEAVEGIRGASAETRRKLAEIMRMITIDNDGYCGRNESIIIEMFTNVNTYVNSRILSVKAPFLATRTPFILYVENREKSPVGVQMEGDKGDLYADLENIVSMGGFELVHIPRIADHYKNADKEYLKRLLHLVSPTQTAGNCEETIKSLSNMSSQDFYREVICDKLGAKLEVTKPIWLIQIGYSVVNGVDYVNFLCMEVERDAKKQLRDFISAINGRTGEFPIVVNRREDASRAFLYRGFHRAMLDVLSIKKVERWEIHFRTYGDDAEPFVDPETGKKTVCAYFKEGAYAPLLVSARDAAFYLLMLFAVALGDECVNFEDPARLDGNMRRYEFLYQRLSKRSIDGETEFKKCPDVNKASIRIPMKSRLSTAIRASALTEQSLYLPQEKQKNMLSVPVDPSCVFIETPRGVYQLSQLAAEARSGASGGHNLLKEYSTLA